MSATTKESAEQASTGHETAQAAAKKRRHVAAQYVRFLLVGLSNAVVDLGVLNALLYLRPTHDPVVLAVDNTIAVVLAILNSYLWNTRWTFRLSATGALRERALFVAQGVLNVVVNDAVLLAVAGVLQPTQGLWYLVASNVAKLIAMLTASTMSFILLRTIVFRRR